MRGTGRWEWIGPITGLVFVCLAVVGALVTGETPAADASGTTLLAFYDEHHDRQIAGALLAGLSLVFLMFFLGALRKTLRDAEGSTGGLSAVAFGGGLVAVVGLGTVASLQFALAEAPNENMPPAVAQALNMLLEYSFIPLTVGAAVFSLAAGLAVLRTRVLGRALGWAAAVAGVALVSPAFFVGGLLILLWIAVTSVLLARRVTRPNGREAAVRAAAA